MTVSYDLILRSGYVVDPANEMLGFADIGVRAGKVARVESNGLSARGTEEIDASGLMVIPGMIDGHVHLADQRRGGIGHRRLALAGVTSAVEFADFSSVVRRLPEEGAGLNLAGLNVIGPYLDSCPDEAHIRRETRAALRAGALGTKIFGGHFPSSLAATEAMIRIANEEECYVAYHVGTTASASNILGMRELPELVGKHRLHLAHVNAYLRGMTEGMYAELAEGFGLLRCLPQLVSESHLAPDNGTSGAVEAGVPSDAVTRNCLRMGGYPATRTGLEAALREGYARVNVRSGDRMEFLEGQAGFAYWSSVDGNCGLSFPVNRRVVALACAVERREGGESGEGEFLIDALASDGGAWRNVLLSRGLPLVEFGALSLGDLVTKLSVNPARMFGFRHKGHLGEGADADITVIDKQKRQAVFTVVGGRIIAREGRVVGSGAQLYTQDEGIDTLRETGYPVDTVDLQDSLFYRKASA